MHDGETRTRRELIRNTVLATAAGTFCSAAAFGQDAGEKPEQKRNELKSESRGGFEVAGDLPRRPPE